MKPPQNQAPDWNRLYETAASQDGLFTSRQALEAGYSPPLLIHYQRKAKVARVRRGIYRLIHFPAPENEHLSVAWLWSEQAGVISHQSALALHGLSDILPSRIHLTLPGSWRHRRFRVPADVVLHHADVPQVDRTWFGAVPITTPRRTLEDCAKDGLSPEILRQAVQQAIRRGLVSGVELESVAEALAPFGGGYVSI
jgi:predicted transcriptional regulator of viral defense system